jgi:hypothetical protein
MARERKRETAGLLLLLSAALGGCGDVTGLGEEPDHDPVPAPVIADISPDRGKSGSEVTITGMNFGVTPGENAVTLNGTVVAVLGAGKTDLLVRVPPDAGSGPMAVTVAGQTAIGPEFTWFPDETRFVDTGGMDDANDCFVPASPCATIAHAIDMSDPGDVIEIAAGVYTETLDIDRSISLRGAGQDPMSGTVIEAHAEPGMAKGRVILIREQHEVSISDLTIRHGVATTPFSGGGGIRVRDDSTVSLVNVTLERNRSSGDNQGGGMDVQEADVTLTNVKPTAAAGWPTSARRFSSTRFSGGNTAATEGNEIYNGDAGSISLLYCLYGNAAGDVREGGAFAAGSSVTEDPRFVDAGSGDLRPTAGPAINAGDPDTDVGAFPTDERCRDNARRRVRRPSQCRLRATVGPRPLDGRREAQQPQHRCLQPALVRCSAAAATDRACRGRQTVKVVPFGSEEATSIEPP